MDKKDKLKYFSDHADKDAMKWFKHDAYKPFDKKELPRHTVTSYMESKGHDVKGVISDGRCEESERTEEGLFEKVQRKHQENIED
jgi:hypothetical protein